MGSLDISVKRFNIRRLSVLTVAAGVLQINWNLKVIKFEEYKHNIILKTIFFNKLRISFTLYSVGYYLSTTCLLLVYYLVTTCLLAKWTSDYRLQVINNDILFPQILTIFKIYFLIFLPEFLFSPLEIPHVDHYCPRPGGRRGQIHI